MGMRKIKTLYTLRLGKSRARGSVCPSLGQMARKELLHSNNPRRGRGESLAKANNDSVLL